MNIFESYLIKISNLIKKNQKELNLIETNNFRGVTLEIPPSKIKSDLSTNICMVLAKLNKINPNELSTKVKDLIQKNISDFKDLEIAGPGFLNIILSKKALSDIINSIFNQNKLFGSMKRNLSYNIEFVSANPTGPMHVGHCRGAIYGDVLSNLLTFNGNKVTKEYYINDYGNQIRNFVKSVFLRIREIKYKEKFLISQDLYPGEYIVEIAKKLLMKIKIFFSKIIKNHMN